MAKNIGLIKISGKVGDLQFFTKDGKTYVGLAANVSKDRIMKDPAYKRTRENMAEFGGSAKVSKAIREGLVPLKKLIEKEFHTRLTKLIRETINSSSGLRGKRAVEFTQNADIYNGYELNPSNKVSEILFINMLVETNAERNELNLTIDEFLPQDYMLLPEGATHFKIHLAAYALSDFAPVGPKVIYKPINSTQHGLFSKTVSAAIPIDQFLTGGLTLSTVLPGSPVLAANVSLVSFVAVEFLQEVNGVYYTFASNNAIRIEKLF